MLSLYPPPSNSDHQDYPNLHLHFPFASYTGNTLDTQKLPLLQISYLFQPTSLECQNLLLCVYIKHIKYIHQKYISIYIYIYKYNIHNTSVTSSQAVLSIFHPQYGIYIYLFIYMCVYLGPNHHNVMMHFASLFLVGG